jgi:hypothetical protein
MDHPCDKCGHSVEDGKAFCSQCGAPQIRVVMPESAAEPMPAVPGVTPEQGRRLELGSLGIPASSLSVTGSQAVKPCALAAAVAVALMFLGLNPFVAAPGAGFLAIAFYRRHRPGTVIRAGAGARLGAFGGLLFFGMSTIGEMLAVVLLHKGAEMRGEMIDKVQQAATRYPGPEVQPFLDFVKSPGGFTFILVASLIFGVVAFIILGGLGGVLGATVLGRRNRS